MKHHTLDNWKNGFRHDGLLYFAQRINEMLDPETDHLFKAPVLNTYLLVEEYLTTSKLSEEDIIDKKNLDPIMEEFQYSFEKDIVIKRNIDESEVQRILSMTKDPSPEKKKSIMEYLRDILVNYNQWCKECLHEIVPQEKEKKKIEQAIRCFIPGLIAFGYSRDYIHNYNIDVFFKQDVNGIDSLDIFLDRFDFCTKQYDVYIAINSQAKQFQDILSKRLRVNFGPFPEGILKYDTSKYILIKSTISAIDEYSASERAFNRLNIFFNYYQFLADRTICWYSNEITVLDAEKRTHLTLPNKVKLTHPKPQDPKILARNSELIILSLQNKEKSFQQINTALGLHNIAMNETDIKNQFLDLWSVLEILFVLDKDKSTISEVVDKMLPVLLKDFFCYQFISIDSELRELAGRIDLKLLEEQFPEEDKSAWTYYIVALDRYSEKRKILYGLLKDYPLLRSRIAILSELSKNKKELSNEIEKHSKRLSWHITRLYRARNAIVHAGMNPDYLHELLNHLHSYTDQCIYELLNVLVFKFGLRTISNALVESQLRTKEILSLLNQKEPLSREDLVTIMKYDFINIDPS